MRQTVIVIVILVSQCQAEEIFSSIGLYVKQMKLYFHSLHSKFDFLMFFKIFEDLQHILCPCRLKFFWDGLLL